MTSFTLKDLEDRLDPEIFFRAHKSRLVNLNQVKAIVPWFGGRFKLVMRNPGRLRGRAEPRAGARAAPPDALVSVAVVRVAAAVENTAPGGKLTQISPMRKLRNLTIEATERCMRRLTVRCRTAMLKGPHAE